MDIVIDALPAFFIGLILGIALMAVFNKIRSGAANPGKTKREFDEYQAQVEAHFEETSRKFQSMATQYQELYEHLAVGAVSLCRTEKAVKLLDSKADAHKTAQLDGGVTPKHSGGTSAKAGNQAGSKEKLNLATQKLKGDSKASVDSKRQAASKQAKN